MISDQTVLIMVNKWMTLMISDKQNVINGVEAHLNVQCIEMANYLVLPLSKFRKILLSKEKFTNGEFKGGAHFKGKKALEAGT
jgi:hypothetical protein